MSTLTAPSKAATTTRMMTENWLRNAFSSELHTVEARVADGDHLPSVAVLHALPTDEAGRVPLLLVEVSDAPIEEYPGDEAGRHAAAGIRDYWVLEVAARKLHVFRDPQPDPDARHGYSYKQVRVYSQYSLVSPLAAELHLAQVANLLPW